MFLATYETPILCLKLNAYIKHENNTHTIDCQSENLKLFITEVQYENDFDSYCYNKQISKEPSDEENFSDKKCYGYNKVKIASECNGKSKCIVKLDNGLKFDEKFIGYKSCDNFMANRLIVSYECIDGESNNVLFIFCFFFKIKFF